MKIGLKRLLKLADILDVADAEHRKRGERTYNQEKFAHPCGTPACALGHYAANTPQRWRVPKRGFGVMFGRRRVLVDDDAVLAEFGISIDESELLFGSWGCGEARTAKQAAKYIRKFVARKQKELER